MSRAMPPIVGRAEWRAARDAILDREKAHTREGDAIAAARRRLPMTEMPSLTVTGPRGAVSLLEVFEGRRLLIAYFHMWHDGKTFDQQCPGCTIAVSHMQMLDYLHARGVTFAVFSEGTYEEGAAFREFMGYSAPWYSAKDSIPLSSMAAGSASLPATCVTAIACSRPTGPQTVATKR